MTAPARSRLDQLLVERGLFESRERARRAVMAGVVEVDGRRVDKPGQATAGDARLTVAAPAEPFVSRAGRKLAAALDHFAIDPAGLDCLDVGASTGGFTDVLLARGAAKVYAVDVGGGQLHARLRADARVASLEHTDARALTRDHIPEAPSLIVCDVSFIGAAKALAAPLSLAAARADLIALIKPQFEAGPHKRAVLDEATARAAGEQAIAALDGLAGFARLAAIDSPIRGGDGNLELLLHARRSPARGRGGDPGAKQGATEG